MCLLIGFIAFFAINAQLTSGSTEVDVNLMHSAAAVASAKTLQNQNIAALTSDGGNFFDTDVVGSSDVENLPITFNGGGGGGESSFGGNVSFKHGSHAEKLYNWDDSRDDFMGSIDMYPDSNDYDYGKYIKA